MPQITTIRVVRKRSVQPEQYGNAAAEVELVGNVLDGEDYRQVARQMLNDSRTLVYENLGLKLPAQALASVSEKDTPTETAYVTVEEADEFQKQQEEAKPEKKKKGPGRPKGSKNKKTEDKQAKDDSDEIPNDDEPQIRTNPEDRKGPNDDDDEIPGDDDTPTKPAARKSSAADDIPDDDDDSSEEESSDSQEFTQEDLYHMTNEAVKAGSLSVHNAKKILSEMGVARWRDLPDDKVADAKRRLELAIEAGGEK